ncbi:MAG: CoA transferase subunit A, partial [Anaerolineae bacterium]|nr:CoA transferase subunit A [Anaerolineae bacterium]
ELARASKRLIISAEEIVESDEIRQQPDRTIIPYFLVDAVIHAPFGSHPGEMVYMHARDEEGICEWAEAAKTDTGAAAYFEKYVYGVPDHAAYLDLIGETRLDDLRREAERHR